MLATPLASDEVNTGIYVKPGTAATAAGEECHIKSPRTPKVLCFYGFSASLTRMRWNYSVLSKAYGKQAGREKDLENLAGTQVRCGYISRISILFSQGLHGLWMFGDTRQAMGLHLRSTSHGGHGCLRGGSTVTSVPLTHYLALSPMASGPWRRHPLSYHISFPHT